MDCYACEQPAVVACKRCAKPYCEDHGNQQYCSDCLHPASALPSFNLYRGALLTMLVGTALAVFLLVRPPGDTTGAVPVVVGRSSPTATVEGAGGETPVPETPRSTSTPAGTPTPDPSAVPTESPFIEYVVQQDDTLFGIASANVPEGDDVTAYVEAIANLNGIDVDNPVLTVGDTILLPPLPSETPAAE
jgi:hypothetical protein